MYTFTGRESGSESLHQARYVGAMMVVHRVFIALEYTSSGSDDTDSGCDSVRQCVCMSQWVIGKWNLNNHRHHLRWTVSINSLSHKFHFFRVSFRPSGLPGQIITCPSSKSLLSLLNRPVSVYRRERQQHSKCRSSESGEERERDFTITQTILVISITVHTANATSS